MLSALSKHRILSTHSLSPGAIERLSFFFDVQVAPQGPVTCVSHTVEMLQNMAGVITDESTLNLKKEVVEQLPHLRAVCLFDSRPQNLDLDALTTAGIRATGLPLEPDDTVERLWSSLTRVLQNHGARPERPAAGGLKSLKRFSGSLFSSSLAEMPLGIMGSSPTAQRLHSRAERAQARPVLLSPDMIRAGHALPQWLVIPPDCSPDLIAALGSTGLDALPPDTMIVDFSSTVTLQAERAVHPAWRERVLHVPVESGSSTPSQDPSLTIAEQLIAALGFGRQSFHPDNLLNPDVCCESCC